LGGFCLGGLGGLTVGDWGWRPTALATPSAERASTPMVPGIFCKPPLGMGSSCPPSRSCQVSSRMLSRFFPSRTRTPVMPLTPLAQPPSHPIWLPLPSFHGPSYSGKETRLKDGDSARLSETLRASPKCGSGKTSLSRLSSRNPPGGQVRR
jgi:hypothetical protein